MYNPCLCLPHNLILSVQRRAVKVLESRRFSLAYLVAQQYTQDVKMVKDRKLCPFYLVIYELYRKIGGYKNPFDLFGIS